MAWCGETVNYEGEVDDIHYLASLNPLMSSERQSISPKKKEVKAEFENWKN
ncbi:hypothetical protein ACQKKK_21570 [Peribacillus sp. NPDC006672]|uniref:hypothetical protein n=1 Tax=Peribacillus sp. NPDC006672 TaxID=3390606 RepID=UPI003CFFF4DE